MHLFLQQCGQLQAQKPGASHNQMNSCNGGTKSCELLYFAANLEAHPIKKAKIWSGSEENHNSANVDLRALTDSRWDWNNGMAARLNLWKSTGNVMDWFVKPGKYPNWKPKSAMISTHDPLIMDPLRDPTTHADCEKKTQIAPLRWD